MMCKVKQLKPCYINMKINGQKPQDKKTTINAIRLRINQDISALVGVIIEVIYIYIYIYRLIKKSLCT